MGPCCHHAYSTRQERQRRINGASQRSLCPRTMEDKRPGTQQREQHSSLTWLARFSREPKQYFSLTMTGKPSTKRSPAMVAAHSTEGLRASRREKTGVVVFKAWTNERIRRYWKLPCAKTEARVRKLRWTNELSRRPTTHCHILAAIFCDVPFRDQTRAGSHDITGWAERILEDLRSIKETVYGAVDLIRELDGRWMRLLCDTPEALQKFGRAEIRARETTVCIPPWYGTTKSREEEEAEEAGLELRWTYELHDEEIHH